MNCCKKCYSQNITYSITQEGATSKTNHVSILDRVGRVFLILATCGIWLIVPKKKEKTKTKTKNVKTAVCQKCAHSWVVK